MKKLFALLIISLLVLSGCAQPSEPIEVEQQPSPEVVQPEQPLEEETKSDNPIVLEEFGFEISYPEECNIKELASGIDQEALMSYHLLDCSFKPMYLTGIFVATSESIDKFVEFKDGKPLCFDGPETCNHEYDWNTHREDFDRLKESISQNKDLDVEINGRQFTTDNRWWLFSAEIIRTYETFVGDKRITIVIVWSTTRAEYEENMHIYDKEADELVGRFQFVEIPE
ncbi:hypothetical protein ACFL3C_00275 [Patescibacteria group bacterium]